jgi:hypothetical protein
MIKIFYSRMRLGIGAGSRNCIVAGLKSVHTVVQLHFRLVMTFLNWDTLYTWISGFFVYSAVRAPGINK